MHHPSLELLARQFFQIDQWHGATPLGAGNINDTYRIDFSGSEPAVQTRILQRLNHRVFTDPEGVMHNIRAVAEHLEHCADFPLRIPAPLPTLTDGHLLHRDAAGDYWRAFPFFAGTYAPERLPEPSEAYEAARAYGLFLRALRDFPAGQLTETIPGFHDTTRRWAVFLEILEKDPADRVRHTGPEIAAMQEAKPVIDAVQALKTSGALPLRPTHNDTKAGNVLLDLETGRAVAVIDWDTIMPGTVLSDFGDMVRTFAPDCPEDHAGAVSLRPDVVAAMREGFLSQTADFLTPAEREHLHLGGAWIVAEQALRFLTDYLAGDPYYKIAYPEHNLVRARNQLDLLKKWQGEGRV